MQLEQSVGIKVYLYSELYWKLNNFYICLFIFVSKVKT